MMGETAGSRARFLRIAGSHGQSIPFNSDFRSPCKTCEHAKEDKLICKTRPDCPLYIPPQPLDSMTLPHAGERLNLPPAHICPFDGCGNKTRSPVCRCHKDTYYSRIERGITGADLYKPMKRSYIAPRVCEQCGSEYRIKPTVAEKKFLKSRYCSIKCQHRANRIIKMEDVKDIMASTLSHPKLAKQYGVSVNTIRKVRDGGYN